MRIAHVCTENLPVPPIKGGAVQTHIAGILPFVRQLHSVTVFSISDPDLPETEIRNGVRYIRVPAPDRDTYLENLQKAMAREDFDLVHVFNRPTWIRPLAQVVPRAKFVLRIHNAMFEPNKIEPEEAQVVLHRLAAIDTVSDFMADKISALYPKARKITRTIYSGVDLQRFGSVWTESGRVLGQELRERLQLGERPVVLFVGRLSPNKAPHLLISAMKQVLSTIPEAVLLIVGSRWFGRTETNDYIESLVEASKSLGESVRFTGYLPALEIERAFSAGDVFVCTSQWEEPLARVHYEAMAAGLPIITTARGGNPEVVYDGLNGYVVSDYSNPDALAKPIAALLQDRDLRRRLGQQGRKMAECRFGFQQAAAQTLDMYHRAVYRSMA